MSKRRTPPLFEVLSGPDNRPGPARPASVLGGRGPVRVEVPSPDTAGDRLGAGPARAIRLTLPTVFIGSGVILAVFFGGWAVVYHLGAKNKETDLARYIEPQNSPPAPAAAIPAPVLVNVDVLSNSPPAAGSIATPTAPFADPRKSGMNYLHVATLPWKDAEKAVEYLNRSGVAAAAAPAKPVDPFDARAKNLPHVVFAIDGVPSDQYRAMAAKRQALEERVRSIGKRWQREERGPSDFGQPGWSRFK